MGPYINAAADLSSPVHFNQYFDSFTPTSMHRFNRSVDDAISIAPTHPHTHKHTQYCCTQNREWCMQAAVSGLQLCVIKSSRFFFKMSDLGLQHIICQWKQDFWVGPVRPHHSSTVLLNMSPSGPCVQPFPRLSVYSCQ